MSKTIMKKGLRGFTLIELMVVIAIIGVLATIISAPIQTYLKKSRDAKKVADMNEIKNALGQYSVDHNGYFPLNLGAVVPAYIKSLPPNVASSSASKDKYMYVIYQDDADNVVSYHLGVALEFQNTAIQGLDADCYDITTAGTLEDGKCAVASKKTFTNLLGGTGPVATGANGYRTDTTLGAAVTAADITGVQVDGDFKGVDDGSSAVDAKVCDSMSGTQSNCVYDIVP